jgi:hypothetical protein
MSPHSVRTQNIITDIYKHTSNNTLNGIPKYYDYQIRANLQHVEYMKSCKPIWGISIYLFLSFLSQLYFTVIFMNVSNGQGLTFLRQENYYHSHSNSVNYTYCSFIKALVNQLKAEHYITPLIVT